MDEDAVLLVCKTTEDEEGYPKESIQKRIPVYVEPVSVNHKEFYEAMANDIEITMVFKLRQEDWEDSEHKDSNNRKKYAEKIEYEGAIYDIVRSYKTGKSKIQISCK